MNPEPPDYPTLLARSMAELRFKTQAHNNLWMLGQCNWEVDQDQGTILFTNPRGQSITAPVQIIGTYNTQDGTWLWGWDHPSVVPALQNHARTLRDYGEAQGVERLTTRKLHCSELEAWELTALACCLCHGEGAYRGPAGTTLVFMTFGKTTIRSEG
ncbi:DUF6882 domain-containing protein [Allocoleopsis franciscana]|uniref:Uncharacterized protein n=1 Tax=Allocoleopsis franciscana PCC 7113 TaxID=1173027 RepID=K9WEN4_9CYAN|nr:DUF6882 domain-containing protein [Allocoleopsis franciscana]AFZ18870.1 hypothetical protein Mic7113_3124 [Allocoleopsis franciscana PCC 7113]